MKDEKIIGWEAIAKLFPAPYTERTVREKFEKKLLKEGYVFRSYVGRRKQLIWWTFPSMIRKFLERENIR